MDRQTARKMMEEAVKALIDCGQYKVVQATAIRSPIHGKQETVFAILFGDSEDVLQVFGQRLADVTLDEKIAEATAIGILNSAANNNTPPHQ